MPVLKSQAEKCLRKPNEEDLYKDPQIKKLVGFTAKPCGKPKTFIPGTQIKPKKWQ